MGLFDSMVERGRSFSDLNRYTRDFRIVEEKDRKGRVRKQAVYIGSWTAVRDFDRRKKAGLWMVAAMAAVLIAVYVYMVLLTHAASGQIWVILPLLAGLFPCMYLAMGVLILPYTGKPMRHDQYMHSFIRIFRSALAVIIFAAVGLAGTLVYRMISKDWMFLPEDWRFTGSVCAVIFLCAGMIAVLRSMDMKELDNSAWDGKSPWKG